LIILFLICGQKRKIAETGGRMTNDSHRVISISLNEQEWQAFVRLHPQPVVWLRDKIQESLAGAGALDARTVRVGVDAIAPASATAAANTTSATTR
jgi:hypothetical protein